MKLTITRDHLFTDLMKIERARIAREVTLGMHEAARGLEKELEAAGAAAGLGRLARAWQSRVYPEGRYSTRAAAVVYAKGGKDGATEKALAAHGQGAVVKSAHGFYLAVPTDAAPKRGADGKRISPSNFPEGRFNRLYFVFRRNGPSFLIVHQLRARTGKNRGKFMKASASALRRGNFQSVIMFLLYPLVRLAKRYDLDAISERWRRRLPRIIERRLAGR